MQCKAVSNILYHSDERHMNMLMMQKKKDDDDDQDLNDTNYDEAGV